MSPELENWIKLFFAVITAVAGVGGLFGAVALLKYLRANPDKADNISALLAASLSPEAAQKLFELAKGAQQLGSELGALITIVVGLLDDQPGIDPAKAAAVKAALQDKMATVTFPADSSVTVTPGDVTDPPQPLKPGGLG